jgi:osmotically-inducible protein OsmY
MKILKMVFSTLLLLGLLGYSCFLINVDVMKRKFLSKAQDSYVEHNMSRVNVDLKGNGYKTKRVLILTGVVLTKGLKEKAEQIALGIDGVGQVENRLHIKKMDEDLTFKALKLKNRKENHI